MEDEKFIRQVQILADEWDKAEEWVKDGEHHSGRVIIPAINELRYAGRRLIDAFASHKRGDDPQTRLHLQAVKDDLNKARHDVVDAIFTENSDQAGEWRDDIGQGVLQEHFPKYGELFALIKDMSDKISTARKNRDQRDEIYSKLFKKLPDLIELCNELRESVGAILENKKKKEEAQEEMKRNFRIAQIKSNVLIVIATISVLIAVASWLYR